MSPKVQARATVDEHLQKADVVVQHFTGIALFGGLGIAVPHRSLCMDGIAIVSGYSGSNSIALEAQV